MHFCRLLALFSFAWMASATLVPRLSLEELVASSEVIVEGRVVESHAAWDANHRYIWTHYRIRIADLVKGGRSAEVVVSEPGGSLDGENQRIADTVSYAPGEDVVLFASRTPIGYLRTTGWSQGKYQVREGKVQAARSGITLVRPAPSAQSNAARSAAPATDPGTLNGMAVSEFKARIRSLLAAGPRTN